MSALLTPGISVAGFCPSQLVCPTQIIDAGSGVAGSVASSAADAVLQGVGSDLNQAANWLLGHVMDLILSSSTPRMNEQWFATEVGLMEKVALVVVVPVLMAATIGPVLRQDGRRLARVWGVGLPLALLAGLAGSQIAAWGLAVTDALCSLIVGVHAQALVTQFSGAMVAMASSDAPLFVQMIMAGLAVVGAVVVWLELMVRSAGVFVATFFMPLALVGYIWPVTVGVARRSIEVLVSLILSKFVIVACISLGLAALAAGHGADAAVSGAAILLIAAFAPFALLRLAPIVEAAAIAHLEGMSRRPGRAAMRAATSAAGVPSHPITQMVMSAASSSAAGGPGGSGGLSPQSIVTTPLPARAPDYPFPSPDAGRANDQEHV